VDYPNLFIMFPIALATFFRSGTIENLHRRIVLKISFPKLFAVLGVIIPLAFLLWVNQMSYGSPFKLSGSVPTIESVSSTGLPIFMSTVGKKQIKTTKAVNTPPPSTLTFFQPRNMLNGFYILLISPDRGILMYTPVMLFGIAGMFLAGRKKQKYLPILLGVVGFNFLLYSMWGDPYGGWAFGGRYLIPTYAILSIYIALLLTYLSKKRIVIFFFFIILAYSIMVNSLGALTSNSNPPQIQAQSLSDITHSKVSYTYMRNVNDLNSDISKSFIFQTFAENYISAWQYYTYITLFILAVTGSLIGFYLISLNEKYRKGGKYEV